MWLVLDGLHPVPQYWIEDGTGRLARADLAFPEQKVAVEYDGSWRDGEVWALNRDRDRLNRVQVAGWEIVFVTAHLLNDPARMVRTVRAAIIDVADRTEVAIRNPMAPNKGTETAIRVRMASKGVLQVEQGF
ncbi:MAG: hypothetical protein WCC38_10630 [Pseudonocardiaceae bacterium]